MSNLNAALQTIAMVNIATKPHNYSVATFEAIEKRVNEAKLLGDESVKALFRSLPVDMLLQYREYVISLINADN